MMSAVAIARGNGLVKIASTACGRRTAAWRCAWSIPLSVSGESS
jgi:hypothetical protein